MEKITLGIVIVGVLIGLCLIAFVFAIVLKVRQAQYAYNVLYEDLKTFKYFVENCSVSVANKGIILTRLRIERARDEFEVANYGNLVGDIDQTYIERFISLDDRLEAMGAKLSKLRESDGEIKTSRWLISGTQ